MIMDLVPWIVRAVIIIAAIILAIMIWRGKKEGRYQEINLRFLVIGITALVLGLILLVVFFITGLLLDMALFLTAAGAIIIIIGVVIRNTWEKTR